MIMMTNLTTTNQQDYYLLKEVTNAAMIDSIDFKYYRSYGEVKINREKFVENFVRRFGQSISKNNTYKIEFYSIYENPPSLSIRVTSNSGDYNIQGNEFNVDVTNSIDAILESNNKIHYEMSFYSLPYASCDKNNEDYDATGHCNISIMALLNEDGYYKEKVVPYFKEKVEQSNNLYGSFNEDNIKVLSSSFLKLMNNQDEINEYDDNFISTYSYVDVDYNMLPKFINSKDFLADDVSNVNFTVIEKDDNKYLSWNAKFKCKDTQKINENSTSNIVKEYRVEPSYLTQKSYLKKYATEANLYNTTESTYYNQWTPYYNACLIGIKYKIIFYYDF